MGFTPQQVDRMTLWQFMACLDGYNAAHGGKKKSAGGDVEEHELRELGIEGF